MQAVVMVANAMREKRPGFALRDDAVHIPLMRGKELREDNTVARHEVFIDTQRNRSASILTCSSLRAHAGNEEIAVGEAV